MLETGKKLFAKIHRRKYYAHHNQKSIAHVRTLRKAREQVKCMVIDGVYPFRIRNYRHLWTRWWATTSDTWHYLEILQQFIDACWDKTAATYATVLAQVYFNK